MSRAFNVGDVVVIDYGGSVSADCRVAKILSNGNVRLEGEVREQWRQDGTSAGSYRTACLRHMRDPEVARMRERHRVATLWLDVQTLFLRATREVQRGAMPWDDANQILIALKQVVGMPVPTSDPEE